MNAALVDKLADLPRALGTAADGETVAVFNLLRTLSDTELEAMGAAAFDVHVFCRATLRGRHGTGGDPQ